MEKYRILTVSQVNSYVASVLKGDRNLQNVYIEGEISNFKVQRNSGHMYFALKDKSGVINAVMFSFAGKYLKFQPRDGISVIAKGNITLYEKSGQYQIQVLEMMEKGIGSLTQEFEKLKQKLGALGYFDEKYKKTIPKYPEKIGIITSPTGAAVRDIYNILNRRFPSVRIHLQPASVQGDNAPKELSEAVDILSESDCDIIIIGRGGGSIEDLWAFNSEMLAHSIFRCKIPVISAVGHETDFTICDFVADRRAPTPSAAAEIAVPDRYELINMLSQKKTQISMIFGKKIASCNDKIRECQKLVDASSPKARIRNMSLKLKSSEDLLDAYSPEKKIVKSMTELMDMEKLISSVIDNKLSLGYNSIDNYLSKLETVNPVSVLKRGYSYTTKDSKNISSVNDLEKGDRIDILFHDGTVAAVVDSKNP